MKNTTSVIMNLNNANMMMCMCCGSFFAEGKEFDLVY